MEIEDKKRFYVQTINSLWVLRGSFRKMQHKKKSYTLIVLPKRRVLPKIPIEWYLDNLLMYPYIYIEGIVKSIMDTFSNTNLLILLPF